MYVFVDISGIWVAKEGDCIYGTRTTVAKYE